MSIGIFDSGLGGLTVVKEVIKKFPQRKIIYFGDTARTPYGNKGKETIVRYGLEDAEFLLKHGAKVIVIGCNTVSSLAADILRRKFSVPVFDVIGPAVKAAIKATKNGRIGVIGTRATINSGVYQKKLKISAGGGSGFAGKNYKLKIYEVACPLFVPLVEEGWVNRPETKRVAEKYLTPLKRAKIDTLILGCTHYPFLKPVIQKIMGDKVKLIDSAQEVAKKLFATDLEKKFNNGLTKHKLFFSDCTALAKKTAQKWLGKKTKIKIAEAKL